MGGIRKKLRIMLLAAAALALSCGSAMAGWNIFDLGAALTTTGANISGQGIGIFGNSINNNGDVVGQAYFQDTGNYHAAYWHDGTVSDLGVFGSAQSSHQTSAAMFISNSGLIAGTAYSATTSTDNTYNLAATFPVGGSPVNMHSAMTFNANNSGIRGGNNNGYMVGMAFNDNVSVEHAILWTPSGTAIDMHPTWSNDTATFSGALAINNNNQIAGWTMPSSIGKIRPTIWNPNSDGTFNANNATYLDLSNDPKYSGYLWRGITGAATDINDSGQATVWYGNGVSGIWQKDGSFTQIKSASPLFAARDGFIGYDLFAINNSGVVVGSAYGTDNATGMGISHAIVYENGTLIDLGALLQGSGWYLNAVVDINDKGQMLVQANKIGFDHAQYGLTTLLLTPDSATPTPIPAALPLFASGLAALGIFRRRVFRA